MTRAVEIRPDSLTPRTNAAVDARYRFCCFEILIDTMINKPSAV